VRQLPRLTNLPVNTKCDQQGNSDQGTNEVSILVSPTQTGVNYLYSAYMPYKRSAETFSSGGYLIKVAKLEMGSSMSSDASWLTDGSQPPPSPTPIEVERPSGFSLLPSPSILCRLDIPDLTKDILGDPVLASNPSPLGLDSYRIWLAGTTHTINKGRNQITVWGYDPPTDAANPVSTAFKVIATVGLNDITTQEPDGHFFDDKPAIAVSQFAGTLGHVYVAYVKSNIGAFPQSGYLDSVQFCSITTIDANGTPETKCVPRTVYKTANIPSTHLEDRKNAPIGLRVDVDSSDGTIYLSWIDQKESKIHVMRSTSIQCVEETSPDGTGCWQQAASETIGSETIGDDGRVLSALGGNDICRSSTNCLHSTSFLSTSLSTGSFPHSLVLVYHNRLGHSGVIPHGSEVMLRPFNTGAFGGTDPNAGFSTAPVRVSEFSPMHDQWQGAVACDTKGTCTVVYYDSNPDDLGPGGKLVYRVYARRLKDDATLAPNSNPPGSYEGSISLDSGLSDPSTFLGGDMEYQDIFYHDGVWYTASITTEVQGPPLSAQTSNVVVSAITPCSEVRRRAVSPSNSNGALPSPVVPVVTDQPGHSFTLSVDLDPGETASWSSTDPLDHFGDGPSITVHPSMTTTYTALISNGCTSTATAPLMISVTQNSGCTPPVLSGGRLRR
jgi:hypothetical protein